MIIVVNILIFIILFFASLTLGVVFIYVYIKAVAKLLDWLDKLLDWLDKLLDWLDKKLGK